MSRDESSRVFSSRASTVGAALLALLAFGPGARAGTPPSLPAAGELVWPKLAVRAEPSRQATRIALLSQFRLDFNPRIVLALDRRQVDGRLWYRIHVPSRPAPRSGWIQAAGVTLEPRPERIVVDRSARRLELYRGNRLLLRTRVAVGKPGAETPLGTFHVAAAFRPSRSLLGDYAFETTAYSKLSDWPGGGVVGIHGTDAPWLLGRAVSHGCIRVSNAAVLKLKRLVPLGTPITVLR